MSKSQKLAKVLNSTIIPDNISGSMKIINFRLLADAKFVYEGFNRNRFLRYKMPGVTLTLEQVKGGVNKKDLRTHNVDLMGDTIYVENNNSQYAKISYTNAEKAKKAFAEIVGENNLQFLQ
jgi:hypothetical protein